MTGAHGDVTAVLVIVAAIYAAAMFALFRYATDRTPAGIVRQLFRTGRPVTLAVSTLHPIAWDPSRPLGSGWLSGSGTATYTLTDATTVRVRYQPSVGNVIDRSGTIPTLLLPDTPEKRRRRRIARVVIAVYLALGLATFSLTVLLVSGSDSLRVRIAALSALGSLALAWLVTHFVLSRVRTHRAAAPHHAHLLAWAVTYVVVSAVFGVFWHLDTSGDTQPIPWPSAFIDAAVFVLITGAVLAATLHHHSYIHHSDDKS